MQRTIEGKTILVVIGSLHKNDIEEILKSEESIEIVQPSNYGKPDAKAIAEAIKREDRLAIATFNLLGLQSKTNNVNWDWLKSLTASLENEGQTPEVNLLKTRLEVLTKQINPQEALKNYQKIYEIVNASEQFTWNGVKDKSRVDSYFDPFGNLSIKQRTQLEVARENYKLNQISVVEDIRKQLKSQLSTTKAQQLETYWNEYLLKMF